MRIVNGLFQFFNFPSLGAQLVTFKGKENQLHAGFSLLFNILQIVIQI